MLSCFSHVRLFAALWTIAHQAPLFTGFSRENTGVGCHGGLTPLGGHLKPGIEPVPLCLLHWQTGSLPLAPSGKPKSDSTYSKNLRWTDLMDRRTDRWTYT